MRAARTFSLATVSSGSFYRIHGCRQLAHQWEERERAMGTPREAEELRTLHELAAEDQDKAYTWGAALARQAAAAARENHCLRVTSLVKEIRALEFHSTEFDHEAAIAPTAITVRTAAFGGPFRLSDPLGPARPRSGGYSDEVLRIVAATLSVSILANTS